MTVNLNKLKSFDYYIFTQNTGTAKELAFKTKTSVATVYRNLDFMRQMGAPIKYDYYRQTYYYDQPGRFMVEFVSS